MNNDKQMMTAGNVPVTDPPTWEVDLYGDGRWYPWIAAEARAWRHQRPVWARKIEPEPKVIVPWEQIDKVISYVTEHNNYGGMGKVDAMREVMRLICTDPAIREDLGLKLKDDR